MMDLLYYDRKGNPLSVRQWAELFEGEDNEDYCRIGSTTIGSWWISTVWIGLDMNWSEGSPIIFETMLFEGGSPSDLYCDRYATEEAALAGHDQAVAFLKQRLAQVAEITEAVDEETR
jgi:hypothetical protein